jgi:uncharacterized membrane protein
MPWFERHVRIDAPAGRIWEVLSDLERWPEWSASMESVRLLGEGPARRGSLVCIKQPGLAAHTWKISDWRPGEGFTWVASGLGLRSIALHSIDDLGSGCVVRLQLQMDGWMAGIAARLYGRLIARAIRMEAEGLRARCEQALAEEA